MIANDYVRMTLIRCVMPRITKSAECTLKMLDTAKSAENAQCSELLKLADNAQCSELLKFADNVQYGRVVLLISPNTANEVQR